MPATLAEVVTSPQYKVTPWTGMSFPKRKGLPIPDGYVYVTAAVKVTVRASSGHPLLDTSLPTVRAATAALQQEDQCDLLLCVNAGEDGHVACLYCRTFEHANARDAKLTKGIYVKQQAHLLERFLDHLSQRA